jgi:hypothetical protein
MTRELRALELLEAEKGRLVWQTSKRGQARWRYTARTPEGTVESEGETVVDAVLRLRRGA